MTVPDGRFWSKVEKSDGCWMWTAATGGGGYGRFKIDGRLHTAHRVAYELAIGDIPEGMQVDHLCNEPACVRPSHLRVCTPVENLMAEHSMTVPRANSLKSHCPQGHPYSGGNLRTTQAGRRCRACEQSYNRTRSNR